LYRRHEGWKKILGHSILFSATFHLRIEIIGLSGMKVKMNPKLLQKPVEMSSNI